MGKLLAIQDNAVFIGKPHLQRSSLPDWTKGTPKLHYEYPKLLVLSDTDTSYLYTLNDNITNGDDILLYNETDGIVINNDITIDDEIPGTLNNVDPFGDGSGVALWKFDGNANDAGGNYNGTWHGTEDYETGVFGQAAASHSDRNNISVNVDITTSFTISFWVKLDENNDFDKQSLIMGYHDHNSYKNYIWIQNNYIKLTDVDENGFAFNRNNSDFKESFRHLVFTVDNDNGKISCYVDNSLVGSLSGNINHYPLTRLMGSYSDGYNKFRGLIDQVRIFNRALTEEEINILYNEAAVIKKIPISGVTNTPTKAWKYDPFDFYIDILNNNESFSESNATHYIVNSTNYNGNFVQEFSPIQKQGRKVQYEFKSNKGTKINKLEVFLET